MQWGHRSFRENYLATWAGWIGSCAVVQARHSEAWAGAIESESNGSVQEAFLE